MNQQIRKCSSLFINPMTHSWNNHVRWLVDWLPADLTTWQETSAASTAALWKGTEWHIKQLSQRTDGATGDKQCSLSLWRPSGSWGVARGCSVKCSSGLILWQTWEAEVQRLISNTHNCRFHIIPSLGSLPHSLHLWSLCKCPISTIPH